ncbi:MAG: cation diffusion facilitator family transporter [Bacteroidota bacterium]
MSTVAPSLKKFIYLSIAAAVATIGLKTLAWQMTDSIGLLSDAMESCVNLVAAVVALIMLHIAEKPADEEHAFGHSKAEYFSSAIEGGLITVAAFSIVWTAIPRLLHPMPLENLSLGLLISVLASLINLVVAIVLLRTGAKRNSITLEADGKHLMTDVWTSAGVLGGIGLVKLTGILILDPIVAILVAANIVYFGFVLLKKSTDGLLDTAIPLAEREKIREKLTEYEKKGICYHSLMTRQAGQRIFISLHVLVPSEWSIKQGHDLVEEIESDLTALFIGPSTIMTHLEPLGDPKAMNDIGLDRIKHTGELSIE